MSKGNKNRLNEERIFNLSCEIGHRLLRNGAEIYRVEESIEHILRSYGFSRVEAFAVPSCIIVSADYKETHLARSVRVRSFTENLEKLSRLNDLCRAICEELPDAEEAEERLLKIIRLPGYPGWAEYLACGAGAFFFTLFWGGGLLDAVVAFFCGLLVRLVKVFMRKVDSNVFFANLIAAMFLAAPPVLLSLLGAPVRQDMVIIGTLMLLVPGAAITNVARDALVGDFLTALSRLAEVLIITAAIAIGILMSISGIEALFGKF